MWRRLHGACLQEGRRGAVQRGHNVWERFDGERLRGWSDTGFPLSVQPPRVSGGAWRGRFGGGGGLVRERVTLGSPWSAILPGLVGGPQGAGDTGLGWGARVTGLDTMGLYVVLVRAKVADIRS